mgnify:CR=1 FL=1
MDAAGRPPLPAGAQLSAVLQISATETFLIAREKAKAGVADGGRRRAPVALRTQPLADVRAPSSDPAREARHAAREHELKPHTGVRMLNTAPAGTIDSKVLDQYAPGLARWLLDSHAANEHEGKQSRLKTPLPSRAQH